MLVKILRCTVDRKNVSEKNGKTYVDLFVWPTPENGNQRGMLQLAGPGCPELPEGVPFELTGVINGAVFGFGESTRQRLYLLEGVKVKVLENA